MFLFEKKKNIINVIFIHWGNLCIYYFIFYFKLCLHHTRSQFGQKLRHFLYEMILTCFLLQEENLSQFSSSKPKISCIFYHIFLTFDYNSSPEHTFSVNFYWVRMIYCLNLIILFCFEFQISFIRPQRRWCNMTAANVSLFIAQLVYLLRVLSHFKT